MTLKVAANSPASALDGAAEVRATSGNLTPDFYAINTMQPPYQPSGNKAAAGGDANLADPSAADHAAAADAAAHRRSAEQREGVVGVVRRRVGRGGSAAQTGTSNVIYGAN